MLSENSSVRYSLFPTLIFGKVKNITYSAKPMEMDERTKMSKHFLDVYIDVIQVSIH